MAGRNATLRLHGVTREIGERLILELDEHSSRQLPSRSQVAVLASIEGRPVTLVLEPDGRRGHWLPLERTSPLGGKPGIEVGFEATVAPQWPETEVPEDLADALDDAVDLEDTWAGLTPLARWEWVRWVKATKNPDTRQRRVEVSISKLRAGKRRPCCFDLSSCTDPEVARSGKLIV